MSRVLIISDNELLVQLYQTNLEVYLALDIMIIKSYSDLNKNLLRKKFLNTFDIILTLSELENKEIVQFLSKQLKSGDLLIPLIVIGEIDNADENIYIIKNIFNIQSLIRTSAKILGITAKTMTSLTVAKYFPIKINLAIHIKQAPCPLYLKVRKKQEEEGDFILFGNKGNDVDLIIKKFVEEGVEFIYVNANDRLSIVDKISQNLTEVIKESSTLSIVEKTEVLEEGFNFLGNFISEEASQEVVVLVKECTKLVDQIVQEVPNLSSLLKIFIQNKNGYLYMHSMLSAYIASHIVRHVSWGGESHIEKINFVLFFHDIHLAPIFEKHPHLTCEEDLLFLEEISEKEKEIILNHARLSAEFVMKLKKCPIGADLLIKQHHGMNNGVGFAVDYKDDISPLSKVIIIGEAFVQELINLKMTSPASTLDIQEIIKNLHERFNKHTYKKIIETLASLHI
jgi:response regulator RpfG family c-di-GMP phosphodiesterase